MSLEKRQSAELLVPATVNAPVAAVDASMMLQPNNSNMAITPVPLPPRDISRPQTSGNDSVRTATDSLMPPPATLSRTNLSRPGTGHNNEKPPPAYTHLDAATAARRAAANSIHRSQRSFDAESARTLTLTATNATGAASCFYEHPTTRYSADVRRSESKARVDLYNVDLEPGTRNTSSDRTLAAPTACEVWPGTQTLSRNRKLAIKHRGWQPLHNVDKKKRLYIKIFIAMVIVAAAVGIGIGVSKAVGSGVWKSDNTSSRIGSPP